MAEEQTCTGDETRSYDTFARWKHLWVSFTTGASCGISRGQGGQGGMVGWREEGKRWNPVVATSEGEEHHAYSGHQEEQSDGGYLGDWQMGSSTMTDTTEDHF